MPGRNHHAACPRGAWWEARPAVYGLLAGAFLLISNTWLARSAAIELAAAVVTTIGAAISMTRVLANSVAESPADEAEPEDRTRENKR